MPIIIPGNRLASTGYAIDQSIRFNSADSAYMSRTPSSTGNRKTFTSSFWVKLGDLTDCSLPFPSVSKMLIMVHFYLVVLFNFLFTIQVHGKDNFTQIEYSVTHQHGIILL